MDLKESRNEIDKIDDEINALFKKRMQVVLKVAEYKKNNNLPVLNSQRESEIIERMILQNPKELSSYTKTLFTTLFEVSRAYQESKLK